MKRLVIVVVVLCLAACMVGGRWWVRTAPQSAKQMLVAGGLESGRADAFVATVSGQSGSGKEQALLASGTIEGDEVAIVSDLGGRIVRLDAAEGDEVQANQVLVQLDTSSMEAEMGQAQAAVAAAEANLEQVKAGTHPAEILAAEAELVQVTAERNAAQTRWQGAQALLKNPQEIEAQIAQAQASLEVAAAQIAQAQAQIGKAEVERDQYRGQGSMQEKYLYRVYNYQVEAAKTGLEMARANQAGAADILNTLRALRRNPLALASQVHLAEGQYRIAESSVAVAEARLAELKAGPTPEQLAMGEAQVAQAQAVATALQTKLEKMTLRTPVSGIVTSRSAHAGEAALAGATLLTVADLDEVTLTIYVPEDELGRVYVGQEVGVQVDSFPERVFTGTVSTIAQEAEFTPKNVQTERERVNMVFAVKVRLPNPEMLLKPGMPADAILQGD
jgi:HlyD family secretion protein